MKEKSKVGLLGLFGLTSCLCGFNPGSNFANILFAVRNTDGTFSYSSSLPNVALLQCQTNSGTSCTISSTATAALFNSNFKNVFPANHRTNPKVTWIGPQNTIYK